MKIARKLRLGLFAPIAAMTVAAACLVGTVSLAFAQAEVVRQQRAEINLASQKLIEIYDSIQNKDAANARAPELHPWIAREETAEKALADGMPGLDPNNDQHKILLRDAFAEIESSIGGSSRLEIGHS